MVKNLRISKIKNVGIEKSKIHKLVDCIRGELSFSISSLDVNFISNAQIIKLNKQFLNHDFSTDILTFNYSGNSTQLDGEIFISVDEAKKNSKYYKTNFSNEISRLVAHGILHLLGYDDRTSKDKTKMKKLENKLLERFAQREVFI